MQRADVVRLVAEMEEVRRFQADLLAGLRGQALLAEERIVATDAALATLRILMASATDPADIAAPGQAETSVPAAARQRSPARRLMIEALEGARENGLTAVEVNALIEGAGMSRDTSEKAKAALKREGVVGHDLRAQRWYAAKFGPPDVEAERLRRAKGGA
ncbi:hypothetical protein [Methylobacterium aerolatum]|uniref:Uncharacterized protein n=1 Tax=Methylobacterium aerolatum TaxID=418708 RepID=A0ABU0HXJ5_9HYPH|nr:hypothetical protein [Methylobacterium aerolatum]MDQ0447065.1 hypothetical protein [Methylobacterium aerolatum]GJD37226.1 hypothetical protein FMGBMHLM_4153 [Methylobacterium aerolatum]